MSRSPHRANNRPSRRYGRSRLPARSEALAAQRLDQLLVGLGANFEARRQADIAEDEAPVEGRALADQAHLDGLADRIVDRELQIDFDDLLAGRLHPLIT